MAYSPYTESKISKRKFTHIIFDVDGLLLDTEQIYFDVMRDIASKYGKTYTWEIKVKMMGQPGLIASQIAVDEMQLPITAKQFLSDVHSNAPFEQCHLMPGAEKLLKHLSDHDIPFALATASQRKDFERKMTKHQDIFVLFKNIICGDHPEVKQGKPNPDIFLAAASHFDDNPKTENILVFEDCPNGVMAGKRAKMSVVLVPDKRLDSSYFADADVVLKSLEEFKPEQYGFPAYEN